MRKINSLILLSAIVVLSTQAINIQKLGLEQGLSNNNVTRITQDKQGIMWFATLYGLNRFDGREFKVFTNADENTVNGNELNAVFADPNENLIWIATARRGLNMFDCKTQTFRSFMHNPNDPNSLGYNGPTDIRCDIKGNLWIATYNGGIDYYNKKSRIFTHYNQSNVKGLVSNMAWSVSDDHQGNLYIAHIFDGMSILSVKNRYARNFKHNPNDITSIPNNGVLSVFVDSYKNVWVGTIDGLGLFNPADGKFTVFRNIKGNESSISNNYISCIDETEDKKLLIGTLGDGLNVLDLKQLFFTRSVDKIRFEHIKAGNRDNELSHPDVKSVFHDSFGNIWIGTNGGGVNFCSNKTTFFNTLKYNPVIGNTNSLSHRIAAGLCFDQQNRLWVATSGGGIDLFHDNTKVAGFNASNRKIMENKVLSAYTDAEGNIWFGTFDGHILQCNPTNEVIKEITGFPCKGIEIRCFFEDKDKNIWIASNKGLHVYNPKTGRKTSYYISNSGLTDNVIRAVSQDEKGNMWVGTLGGQICIFNKSFQRIRLISPNNNLYGINQLFKDSKNRMWAATGENLFMFRDCDDNRYKIYGTKQGLSDNFVAAITEGADGRIWFSTNSGISCLNPVNNIVKNYNHFDGVPLGNFMLGAVARSVEGKIYFGSENGICYFDSKADFQKEKAPTAIITDFAVSNIKDSYTGKLQYFPTLNPIQLRYNQNTFTISFNVPDFSYNNRIEFSYMLDGLEDVWYNVKNTRQVTFRNLAPGRYCFHVRTHFKNQGGISSATTLTVNISPPFWFSWWAETIYVLIMLVVVGFIVRFYRRKLVLENSLYLEKQNNLQQQELNAERMRFYTNITHELRTPLTLIIGPLEDLKNDLKLQENYRGKVNSIYKSAVRLLELINQILEFRKTETQNRKLCVQSVDLAEQIREISLKYEELIRNPALEIQCVVETGNYKLVYDPEVITIILDNLISNAIKYTPAGKIRLKLKQFTESNIDYTEIEVSDSGLGIDLSFLPHIFDRYYQVKGEHQASGSGIGLSIVKNLVDLHEAEINVESKPGQGTVFHVRLLTNNTYHNALHTQSNETRQEEIHDNDRLLMLVVEDNADILKYVADTFTDEFEVLTSENGSNGLEIALNRIPDIIISDIMMPVMNGTEFCKQVKGDYRTSHIPFIMLTAKDAMQDKTDGYTAGADSYITKPFSGTLLRSRVANLLDARKRMTNYFTGTLAQQKEVENTTINAHDKEFIETIKIYIEKHIEDEDINIASIADIVFMSHSTFYRKIKALTGLSASEFIRKIRMQNARKLLGTGSYNISEVMFMIGISSPTYFRKCFKDEFGVSPMEYQKQNKRN